MTEIREYRKATRCERGGRLRRCRRPLAGQCQYCALGFCERHGLLLDDGQQVCSDKPCQAKKEDVERHLVFKAAALQRNRADTCGIPDCDAPLARDCERCLRTYCAEHLRDVVINVVRGTERAMEVVRLCHHCQTRAAMWAEH